MKKQKIAWLLYDFANTAFMVWMVTLLFPVYFRNVLCQDCGSKADLFWGLSGSISMLVAAVLSPILGAMADRFGLRKKFLIFFTFLSICFSAALAFVPPNDFILGIAFFVLANVGYLCGMVFYNAFLPELERPERQGRFSAWGWAAGYLGAFVTLALFYPILKGVGEDWAQSRVRLIFAFQAAFFLIFSLPALFFLKEDRQEKSRTSFLQAIPEGGRRILQTFQRLKEYKGLFRFWIAFFFFSEGIAAILYFASIFAVQELGFQMKELILFYLVMHRAGIIGALGTSVGP
jgi:UMF1 family MFS transporter